MAKTKTKPTSQIKKAKRRQASTARLHTLTPAGVVEKAHVKIHPDLKRYFGYCFYKTAVQMRYLLDQTLAKHGMIAAQFGILRMLKTGGEQNQITLCECLSVDRASMVKLIDGLEAIGLVERRTCAQDRRAKLVRLTAKGLPRSEMILNLASEVEQKMMGRLTQHEQEVLRRAVPKMLDFDLGDE